MHDNGNPVAAEEEFAWRDISPPTGDLAFRFLIPADWELNGIPPDDIDFSDSGEFMPLAICAAKYAPCVCSIAARPAYADGTVLDWFKFLLSNQGYSYDDIVTAKVGPLDALACFTTQDSDAGRMRQRLSLFEDGGRLFNVTVIAPEQIWPSIEPLFITMVESVTLASPRGPTALLLPDSAESESKDNAFADLALADGAASLDPENPINVNIRDSGNGLVPNVKATDQNEKSATVAAGAIMAAFKVPFGWHVIDDGKRTLVFNATGEVQVNLNLFNPEGSTAEVVLDAILAEMQACHPDLLHIRLDLEGIPCLGLRNVREGDDLLEQAYLITPAYNGLMLKTRVTANPEWMTRAMNMAGLIVQSISYPQKT